MMKLNSCNVFFVFSTILFYLNLIQIELLPPIYSYTKFVHASNLYSLRDKLYAIRNEQLNNVIDRQVTNAKRLQYEIENLFGLELFVTREQHRLPTMIAICIPNRFNEQFFRKYSSERLPFYSITPDPEREIEIITRINFHSQIFIGCIAGSW